MNTSQKSDIACFSSYGSTACCWRCAQQSGQLRTLKQETNRNRRRAEPAIVAEQLADIYGPDPDIEAMSHDDTDVFSPGCGAE